jgi:penicillin-binding protein 1C
MSRRIGPCRFCIPRRRLSGAALALTALAVLAGACAALFLEVSVRAARPPSPDVAVSPVVVDRNGQLLRAFTVDDGRWRLPVAAAEVDPLLIRMLLAFEDQRFFAHAGVDSRALLRAAAQALRHGRIVSGGSTLTMQVARLLHGDATRSAAGKWRQVVASLALERRADKQRILAAYLHVAPYGGNLEGVRAASLAWLGKEPARLTPGEAALLVALPQSPRARRPDLHPDAARSGRERVLRRALAAGVIDADDFSVALREPVPRLRRSFPMLAAHAARRAVQADPTRTVHRLTIDGALQARLEQLAAEHAGARTDAVSAALIAADHASGEILAAVGSSGLLDEARSGFVDMTLATRSPGSTLKPLIYGLAFEAGLAHPESLIEDRPTGFGSYAPESFDRTFRGTVTVRRALQLSLNVPAVTLLEGVGPIRLVARLRRAGAEPKLPDSGPPGLAVGLGGIGLTLRDLAGVYAAIASGGRCVALHEQPGMPRPACRRLLDERAAWYLASILSGSDGIAAGGDIAVKTGTSYGYRDAWALGFDGRHVMGVWLGRPDGAAVPGLTGSAAAVPLLRDAFSRIGPATPLPGAPAGVLSAATSELPPPLRRVAARDGAGHDDSAVEIAFPPPGAIVEVSLDAGGDGALLLKARNGSPPFIWLADGRPIARERYARSVLWHPDGPGYTTISVIDAGGTSSRVTVRLQ